MQHWGHDLDLRKGLLSAVSGKTSLPLCPWEKLTWLTVAEPALDTRSSWGSLASQPTEEKELPYYLYVTSPACPQSEKLWWFKLHELSFRSANRRSKKLTVLQWRKTCTKKDMALSLLKILGHSIAKSNWTNFSKNVQWSASCMSFFGSFRLVKLLPKLKTVTTNLNVFFGQI